MPVIFKYKGFRFFFFSNEGTPREPLHVHVRKGDAVAKFWLKPEVTVASSYDMSPKELKELLSVAKENAELIERTWNEYFNS